MRDLLILISATFVLVGSLPATAQTPDGMTPAEETDCDVLIGATPGLYGLCVAFCEAHDADPSDLDVPDQMILEIYNKKMVLDDPPMPCLEPDEPQVSCPCWSADELLNVWPPSDNIDLNFVHACANTITDTGTYAALVNYEDVDIGNWILLEASTSGPFEGHCLADNMGFPEGPSKPMTGITEDVFHACKSLLAARANAATDGTVWDCFVGE